MVVGFMRGEGGREARMGSETPEWESLAKRLEKLEKRERVRRWGIPVVLLLVLASQFIIRAAGKYRVLEGEELIINDGQGTKRIRLGLWADGSPNLTLFDRNQKIRVLL